MNGTVYVGHYGRPVTPALIRSALFSRAGRRAECVDELEVRTFLNRVAATLEARDDEIAALREENARIKSALSSWQSQQFEASVRREAAARHQTQPYQPQHEGQTRWAS